jgi:hypothetical protein
MEAVQKPLQVGKIEVLARRDRSVSLRRALVPAFRRLLPWLYGFVAIADTGQHPLPSRMDPTLALWVWMSVGSRRRL